MKNKSSKGFKFTNRGNRKAEILIYDDIGGDWFGGLTAKEFAENLKSLGNVSEINVRINSVGGAVFDGVAIYNSLYAHSANIVVDIDGAALSIASIIAMAGNEINMAKNAFMMIHEPNGIFSGDAKSLRKQADTLELVRDQLLDTYSDRRGIDKDKLDEWISAETWFDSAQALEHGFIDNITSAVEIAAKYDLSRFDHPPKSLQIPKNSVKSKPSSGKSSASAALTRMNASIKARKL